MLPKNKTYQKFYESITSCALTLFIIASALSCNVSGDNSKQTEKSESPMSQFIELRYNGKFRSDSLYENAMKAQIAIARENKNKKLLNTVLQMFAELDLLNENQTRADETLKSLEKVTGASEPTYNWLLAFYYANEKKIVESRNLLTGILEAEESNYEIKLKTHWLMATIYEDEGADMLALKHYNQAKNIGPMKNSIDYYVESVFHLGHVLYGREKFSEAKEEYDLALTESLKYDIVRLAPFGYYHLGKINEHEGQNEQALDQYNKGLDYLKRTGNSSHFLKALFEKKIAPLKKSS